jgi:hypothetical protein
MRNKKIFLFLFLIQSVIGKSQTLVFGGFASFAISDSLNANSGGSFVWNDSRSSCIMLQGGNIYGNGEIYNKKEKFQETCKEPASFSIIKVYPNPGFGNYWIEGQNIQTIEILDNLGRLILSPKIPNDLVKIPISIIDQAEGNYFVKIIDINGKQSTFSIIKLQL